MAVAGFELANELTILRGGRNPRWTRQTQHSGAPSAANDGVWLRDAVVTAIMVALREVPGARTGYVTITNVVDVVAYRVIVDGNTVAIVSGAGSTAASIIQQLVLALPGVPAAAALVSFTAVDTDGDGVVDALRVRGLAEADYTLAVTSGGAGTIACVTEFTSAWIRVYFTPTGTVDANDEPYSWAHPDTATYSLDYRGFVETFETGSCDRAYVEVYNTTNPVDGAGVTYEARVHVGPAILE
jgi:hypothetical protein